LKILGASFTAYWASLAC